MLIYILKRLALIIPTLFLIMLVNFAVIQTAPGGPVDQAIANAQNAPGGLTASSESQDSEQTYQGSRGLSADMIAQIEAKYGFDKPAPERFLIMVGEYLRFDFGESFFKGKAVTDLLWEKMPVTLFLGLWSTLLIYLVAVPLGVYKALRHGSRMDQISSLFLAVGHAIPVLVFGVLLLVLFAGGTYLSIFPLQGMVSEDFETLGFFAKIKDYLWHLALPLTASVVGGFAALAYLTKFSFMEELGKQYVLSAKAKGLTNNQVLYGHVFRNAMLIVIAGLPAAFVSIFFTSNLFIEIVFNLDGLGLLGFEAIQQRDYPIIFGTLYLFTLVGLLLQLITDLAYHWVDPRINFEEHGS